MVGLNESPSEKEGKSIGKMLINKGQKRLNESPSEKEGKSLPTPRTSPHHGWPQ